MNMRKGCNHPIFAFIVFFAVLFGGAWILTTFAMEDIILGLVIIGFVVLIVWFIKENWE